MTVKDSDNLPEKPIRVLLHSDVVPGKLGGGELLLFRHLVERDEIIWLETNFSKTQIVFGAKWIDRLKHTRLRNYALAAENLLIRSIKSNSNLETVREFQPDVVVTVAHGIRYRQASQLAELLGVPIVSIYHDWWPDMMTDNRLVARFIEMSFKSLQSTSTLSLAISEGMRAHLGSMSKTVVIPPIAGSESKVIKLRECDTPFSVCYAGNLYCYGKMIGELLQSVNEGRNCRLKARGPNPAWEESFKNKMEACGNYLPSAPRSEINDWLQMFDSHLCVMRFERSDRRRMETSFPSKMVDSFKYGKPVIVWGPEYCSAIQWNKGKDAIFAITDEDPVAAAKKIEQLAHDKDLQVHLGKQSTEIANNEFSPNTIQNAFIAAIRSVI